MTFSEISPAVKFSLRVLVGLIPVVMETNLLEVKVQFVGSAVNDHKHIKKLLVCIVTNFANVFRRHYFPRKLMRINRILTL